MARCARQKSSTGIYHVMQRGINRQTIFYDKEDYSRFLEIVKRVKESGKVLIYAYCLMGNHVHLLLHEKEESVSTIMKRIGTSYAWWYNKKYDRIGHVFQNRFQSEIVETEPYLLEVLRYIHNNPVKAKLVAKPEEYKWSSYQSYSARPDALTHTEFIFNMLNSNREIALQQIVEFIQQEDPCKCLECTNKPRKKDEELTQEIQTLLDGQSIVGLQSMERSKRNEIIRQIKKLEGVTQRQIARVTGIHPSIIFKI